MHICVYCSASNHLSPGYYDNARELGRLMAERGHTLVYGGGNVGLMGSLALSVKEYHGQVVGVIPQDLQDRELGFHEGDELIVTGKMQERKHLMDKMSQAFIALPGGYGTLDELFESITLKQLGFMEKPIVLVNCCGFFDKLMPFLDHLAVEHFVSKNDAELFVIVDNPVQALDYIESHSVSKSGVME